MVGFDKRQVVVEKTGAVSRLRQGFGAQDGGGEDGKRRTT
jgi:hypothetical protein